MTRRADYLLQIFEKIGAPLLSAIGARADKAAPDEAQLKNEAKQMAELLGKSVQLSIDLGKMTGIETAPETEADRLRVALAALAGPLVAAQYKQTGRTPAENDLKRLSGALEAVLTFSENFTPDDAHIKALQDLQANGTAVSAHQSHVQYLHLFTPVIDAVSRFSFGQQEKSLMRDIAGRLTNEAGLLRKEIFGDSLQDGADKVAELALLRTLAEIYALSHNQETDKLGGNADGGEGNIKAVWGAFETRLSMLQILGENLVTSGEKKQNSGENTPPPTPEAVPQQDASQQNSTPQAPENPAPPPAETPPAASAPATTGSPMSFFGAKKDDGEQDMTTPPPVTQPPSPPATPETPPENPVEPPKPDDQVVPPTPPPAEAPPPAEEKKDGDDQTGGSPMSFFKKGDE